ncbi:related to hormone-sensitive lipase [Cephalotrichum gorgonifer]|uniref:Related to hormone-sensitive lipase n=1 Tax=Cephalotrichum gorgonifer TaxID=2041049 RepID=A0AAE8SW15_9PEZI|nr:related to hormone-sensitive lipase [Cephalotrichum gorgonifer]
MLDHVLGRPSTKSRRLQVLAVLSFWSFFLFRGHKHGPPGAHTASRFLSKSLTAWQIIAATMLYLYASRNFSTLVGLASPDPMSNMYEASFFRATWVLTALDAGFWTAMRIRSRRLRDLASFVFSIFYLFAAEKADEKVRKVRSMITVDHLRVSWDKGKTPYLSFFQGLMRPRFTRWPPRAIRIPRPAESDYSEPVEAWLYYDGPIADLQHHDRVLLDIPGGGFVAMDPRCNDDKLFCWAAKTGLPVLAVDYKKAPEFPYPHAINECFDVYSTIMKSKGRCLGMSGRHVPRVVITGDSAGGNLAVATTIMIIERCKNPMGRNLATLDMPLPDGLVLFYPSLDMNIGNWMSEGQMSLIRDRQLRRTNKNIIRRKARQYNDLVGTPHHSDEEDETPPPKASPDETASSSINLMSADAPRPPRPDYSHAGPPPLSNGPETAATATRHHRRRDTGSSSHRPELLKTRLAVSSMISYFNDRVLTPEMMRAMIILYIGPHNRPDFSTDYLLSPVLAPSAILEHFPKTCFLTGERDPLVDDTVIFAGRLTKIKEAAAHRRWAAGMSEEEAEEVNGPRPKFNDKDAAEVVLLPGVSHGFLQFPTLYPPAWKHLEHSAVWIQELFVHAEKVRREATRAHHRKARSHARQESSGDEDKPLEINMTRMRKSPPMKPKGPAPDEADEAESRSRGKIAGRRGRGGRAAKTHSLVRLDSQADLLGRRMQGLTNGLTGVADDEL